MKKGRPSTTCIFTAIYRALHQTFDNGVVFRDPVAKKILNVPDYGLALLKIVAFRDERLRYLYSARSAFSELYLDDAVFIRGVTQIVILGAGFDTLPYRNRYGENITYFEIDHPATQGWKLRKLKSAKIAIPKNVLHAPCDFEDEDLFDVLKQMGFDRNKRSYFLWLGTIPYLTDQAALSILKSISMLEGGAEIVFDYGEVGPLPMEGDTAETAANLKKGNEPYISTLNKMKLHQSLGRMGYEVLSDLDHLELLECFLPKATVDVLMRQDSGDDLGHRRIFFGIVGDSG